MRNTRIYLLVICALVLSAVAVLSSGSGATQAQLLTPDVEVVNKPNKPVPVAVQGTTSVAGTVNVAGTVAVSNFPNSVAVSNFPDTQSVAVTNFPGTQAVTPAGSPITLNATLGLSQPINSSEHVLLSNAANGFSRLSGQVAIGSISVAATQAGSGTPGEIYFDFFATDCSGNGLGELRSVVMRASSTMHLDFPTPQMAPAVGSRDQFCVEVNILNGNNAGIIDITFVGSAR